MEKSSVKPKNRLLKLAASAVTFQNPPFSPSKEKRSSNATHNIRKGFSGPMISIIPAEARYKSRSSSFAAHEPTSPKISCMGQIKHKKKMGSLNKQNGPPRDHQFVAHSTPLEQVNSNSKKTKVLKSTRSFAEVKKTNPQQRVLKSVQSFNEEKKKKSFVIRNMFAKAAVKKGDQSVDGPPSLGQMQRFSSGRNSLSNFDWTATAADDDRNYHSDEERECDREEEEEEEEDCKIGFSAPIIMIGGCKGDPRKEINLWKRRSMAQPPKPLQVNNNNNNNTLVI